MPIPFERDIPRFPATEFEKLTGEVVHIEADPIAPGMPNVETTIFNDTALIRSLDLAVQYTASRLNSKSRHAVFNEAVKFVQTSGHYERLESAVNRLIASIRESGREVEQNTQIDLYRELLEKTKEKTQARVVRSIPASQTTVTVQETQGVEDDPNLPLKAEVRLPSEVYDLVNQALSQFAPEYGTIIKPLLEGDVRICRTTSMNRYLTRLAEQDNHPIKHLLAERLVRQFPGKVRESSEKEGTGTMIGVIHNLPGKPVFIPEAAVRRMSGNKRTPESHRTAWLIEAFGKILIHESIHRTTVVEEPFPVGMSNPFVKMAVAVSNWTADVQTDPKARVAFAKYNQDCLDFAANHNPHIFIEGTRVKLLCADEEARQRVVFESGYDLGEAIPEMFALQLLEPIRQYVRTIYGEFLEQTFYEYIMKQVVSDDNYRYSNVLDSTIPYLEKLGLKTPAQVLHAFAENMIPRLHAKLLADEAYMR